MRQLPPVAPRYRIPRVAPYARLTLLWAVVGLAVGFAAALFNLVYVAPVLLGLFGWFAYRRIRITRASHGIRDFIAPMKRQDLPQVVEVAERLVSIARVAPGLLAIVVMTRAYVFLRQGDADVAAALFREVERSRWLARSQKHPQLSFFYRNAALAAALRVGPRDGEDAAIDQHDIDEATRLLGLAESNSDARDAAAQDDLVTARAVLALRSQRAGEALDILDAYARARSLPTLRLLRTFALRQLSRPTKTELATLRETVDPSEMASLSWLGADWSALRALQAQIRGEE